MTFNWVPGDRGARLRSARFDAIDRLLDLAHAQGAAFVLIAGDLFDANTVDESAVIQACACFARANVPVVAIPGRHDHGGPGSVWRRASFRENRPENLLILEGREPLVLAEGRALLLPAPLTHRHERGDPTAWWSAGLGRNLAPDAVRIGLAHGSVMEIDGESSHLIDPQRAQRADLDYLALGGWHGSRELNPRAWYAGTPEPTGFLDHDAGSALVVTATRSAPPQVSVVPVAHTQWIQHAAHARDAGHVMALGAWFDGLDNPLQTLVRLELSGALGFEDIESLDGLLRRWEARLVYLDRGTAGLVPVGRADELDTIATRGYVATAIDALKLEIEAGGERAPVAARALHLLYRLHRASQASAGSTA